jgi:hypothetical protein
MEIFHIFNIHLYLFINKIFLKIKLIIKIN